MMFEDFDGVPKGDHQQDWYVGERWDRRARHMVPAEEAEKRLLRFVESPARDRRRTLRLILGRTGCGKTTFVKYFFNQYLQSHRPALLKSLAPLYIDCAEASVAARRLEQDVDRRTDTYLRERYPVLEQSPHYLRMWDTECDFDKPFYLRLWQDLTPAGTLNEKLRLIEPKRRNVHDFNRVRINYLYRELGKTPLLIWDNLDHADIDVQRMAIQLARHKLSWVPDAKVIICVREGTVPFALQEIAPAAYRLSDQELFTPDVHSVLAKRATAAKAVLAERLKVAVSSGTDVDLAHPEAFLDAVLDSLKTQPIQRALCELSCDNLRSQLVMVERVLRSGHIPAPVISGMIRGYSRDAKPQRLSWRRFAETLICGEYRFRRGEGDDSSLIINLFQPEVATQGYASILCMPRLLYILDKLGHEMALNDLERTMAALGYPAALVAYCVRYLADAGLVRSSQGRLPDGYGAGRQLWKRAYYIGCSECGQYYSRVVLRSLVYVQHMAMVTDLDPEFRNRIGMYEPHQLPKAAIAAAALISQVRADEAEERTAADRSKAGSVCYRYLKLGGLANYLVRGCLASLAAMQKGWLPTGSVKQSTWRDMQDVIRAA